MADAHEGSSLSARAFKLQICHPSSRALMTKAASPGVAGVRCWWYATAVANATLTNPIPARDAASPVEDPTGLGKAASTAWNKEATDLLVINHIRKVCVYHKRKLETISR